MGARAAPVQWPPCPPVHSKNGGTALSPPFFHGLLVDFANKGRLPTMFMSGQYVAAGGLASYGPNFSDGFRHAARYVDKILKGAKPGDLPVEQPTRFELIINANTAKALGLTLTPSVLTLADEVIQ
jgi:putative tryptophan/tyrosine transport system substrate-binding protein